MKNLLNMFRDKFQKGCLPLFSSSGKAPLELWDTHVKNGFIRRITDEETNSLALEIAGTNVSTTYIYTPKDPKNVLGICLPFVVIVIKNMKKYFTFEITILDDQRMHRRFRASNFQSVTRVKPFSTSMPIGLSGGWNQIQFNLAEFTRRAYGTNYVETTRMQIHANCRIRRIYFSDELYEDKDLPEELRLNFPPRKCGKSSDGSKSSLRRSSKSSVGGMRYDMERMGSISGEESMFGERESRTVVTPEEEPSRQKINLDLIAEYENQGDEITDRESEFEDIINEENEGKNVSISNENIEENDENEENLEVENKKSITDTISNENEEDENHNDDDDDDEEEEILNQG